MDKKSLCVRSGYRDFLMATLHLMTSEGMLLTELANFEFPLEAPYSLGFSIFSGVKNCSCLRISSFAFNVHETASSSASL
jgi:hypothetical protein